METTDVVRFSDLGLNNSVLKALDAVGYETPSPIQAATIPPLLAGRDVLGQAQTGTGKTAAFALPILNRIELAQTFPQALVLVPTRELAIQVAEAFQRYASHLTDLHVLPIYGGSDYGPQVRNLKRGVHIVVGTPGRVMDHMRRGTLNLENLTTLVLDEADEMLRMGFIDDVKWVLEQTPPDRQVALFSATMPREIQTIAERHMQNPEVIAMKVKTTTAETINQRYWMVSHTHKLDALTRIMESEDFDAVIIFVRTKTATVELVEKLNARGYAASALNGDLAQAQRERTINRLRNGELDILVATDVAARGLDVARISHVINYDIPTDTEPYIHRIGRTGRAGRTGEAILFVTPRERRMLAAIERATRQKITLMEMPSADAINDRRIAQFKKRITDTLTENNLKLFTTIIEQYVAEHDIPPIEIAAALAKIVQGDEPLLLTDRPQAAAGTWEPQPGKPERGRDRDTTHDAGRDEKFEKKRKEKRDRSHEAVAEGTRRYRIEAGHNHGLKPGNIVGAIANEAGLDSKYIGAIEIHDDHSIVVLPEMPREIMDMLQDTWVAGQRMRISVAGDGASPEHIDGDGGWFTKGKPRKSGKPFEKKDGKPFQKKDGKPFHKKDGKTFHKKDDKKGSSFGGPKRDKDKGKPKKKHRKGGE
ncbi:MAG: DEAD/DEAH box helicase [Candidatus Hydrogenedentes bacterium]|nr:DEAD/DEAH box helicase [Candidatus Hydrogenedentota bacterium]